MRFTIEEARAGHELARREVERASGALHAATGRRERRAAQAELDRVQSVLDLSTKMLEKIARELGVDPYPPAPAPTAPPPRRGGSAPGPRFADKMLIDDVKQTLRAFGESRRAQGDSFSESEFAPGAYLYQSGPIRTGIRVWGAEEDWVISVFSAARVGMRPGLDLFLPVIDSVVREALGISWSGDYWRQMRDFLRDPGRWRFLGQARAGAGLEDEVSVLRASPSWSG